jgi:hypothetical protein
MAFEKLDPEREHRMTYREFVSIVAPANLTRAYFVEAGLPNVGLDDDVIVAFNEETKRASVHRAGDSAMIGLVPEEDTTKLFELPEPSP